MPPLSKSQINAIPDFGLRTVLLSVFDNISTLHQANGTSDPGSPVNTTQKPASQPPAQPSMTVTGANGTFVWQVTPPTQSVNKAIYYELSYSTSKANFSEDVTTLPPTNATSGVIPSPGTTAYFRVRASYDRTNWSGYAYA
jgi:hypothetical protein